MKVVWNKRALDDLAKIKRFIFKENQELAMRVVLRITQATSRLSLMPEMGRIGRCWNIRELVIPGLPYVVPYRIKDHEVRIIRVFHSSMRWPDRF